MNKTNIVPKIQAIFVLAGLLSMAAVAPVIAAGTPADPPAGSSFDVRLTQRKAEQNEQLDAKTLAHIQQNCTKEQGGIRKLQSSTSSMMSTRIATYKKIDGILLITIGQLRLASQDTFTLEQSHTILAQKITQFQAVSTNYQQTLNDLLTINCQSDPVGFQALLDTARGYYSQATKAAADIRDYIANTTQPAIQVFISQLQSKNGDS